MEIEDANRMLEGGDMDAARSCLLALASDQPRDARVWLLLAGIATRSEDWLLAKRAFMKLVDLRPADGLASSGLVHCLVREENYSDAIVEIDRFISVADPSKEGDRATINEHQATRKRIGNM